MKKRSRNNNNKASRVGPASIKYIDIVTDKLASAANTYKVQYPYNIPQLLPSLQSQKPRLVRFRRFILNFSPTEPAVPNAGTTATMVQLEVIDPVTGNPVPCTKAMTLSETNPRSLSFSLGSEFSRWQLQTDGFKPLIVSVFNPIQGAPVNDFTVTIRSEIDLQMPEPTAV